MSIPSRWFVSAFLRYISSACASASIIIASETSAQGTPDSTRVLRGIVLGTDQRAIEGANVFVLETLAGTLTRASGRFLIAAQSSGAVTLIVRHLGYREIRRTIAAIDSSEIVVVLDAHAVALATVSVQAGQYTANAQRGATLTPLEVVTTPGTAADVNRAIQSLPGVQAGDEGTALFVRGGDFTETRVFLNDAALLTPVQLQSPSGTFIGTVDPFLLDGIFFSSGGFGARFGDALSGVVALKTQGRPSRTSLTATAGLGAVSVATALKLAPRLSLRASANRSDLDPMFRLNRTNRYDPAPHGHDLSASVITTLRATGELNVFAIDQSNALGLGVEEASFQGNFAVDSRSTQGVATWRDNFGVFAPTVSVSYSRNRNATDFGVFRLATQWDNAQVFAQSEWQATEQLLLRAGGEVASLRAQFNGSLPAADYDVKPGARTVVMGSSQRGNRVGVFGEADWHPIESARLILGARTDKATLTGLRTFDPRASLVVAAPFTTTVTAAWGIYHQVPDPLYFDDTISSGASHRPMRAEQRVVGVQRGDDDQMLRLEAYDKRYNNLVQRTRDYDVVSGGAGTARGVDVFAKGRAAFGLKGRASYSFVSSRRTDPDAGIIARAPFDVTHSVTTVIERALASGISLSIAYRHATGRPFTPVERATLNEDAHVYVPQYAAPMSERLPPFHRFDVSASYFRPLTPVMQSVFFVSLMNVLDHDNTQRYRYNASYTQRFPVTSIFQRSLYFGGTLTWSKENP